MFLTISDFHQLYLGISVAGSELALQTLLLGI